MSVEVVLTVNNKDEPLKSRNRDDVISSDFWRRAAGGLVVDRNRKRILCHKRSEEKDERPNYWVATFGGKSKKDEDVLTTTFRELKEEFGLTITDKKNAVFFGRTQSEERRQFEYVFIIYIDSKETNIEADKEEVSEYRWYEFPEVLDSISNTSQWYSYGYEKPVLGYLGCKSSS